MSPVKDLLPGDVALQGSGSVNDEYNQGGQDEVHEGRYVLRPREEMKGIHTDLLTKGGKLGSVSIII